MSHIYTEHDHLMDAYYVAREAQDRRAEDYAMAYDTETETFYREVERKIDFRSWLECTGGTR